MARKGQMLRLGLGFGIALALGAMAGCSGDTDGGPAGDQDFNDTSFVDSDEAAGSISLTVVDTDLTVSETSAFAVRVRDARGGPVPNIEIACDTETGLALIEPYTGHEMTDSNGLMSGRVGCSQTGSHLIGCRLPIGGNKRKFVTVKCAGPVPVGFDGFPGAGGGNLGTGETPSGGTLDDAGTGLGGVRILDIEAYDDGEMGGTSTFTIDVVQGLCGTAPSQTAEPFYDTVLGINVVNTSNRTIRFSSYSFRIDNSDGAGGQFNSPEVALSNGAEVGAGDEKRFYGLFAKATAAGKKFNGNADVIPSGLGFINVTVRMTGTTDLGESVVISGRTALSFDNYNKCGS